MSRDKSKTPDTVTVGFQSDCVTVPVAAVPPVCALSVPPDPDDTPPGPDDDDDEPGGAEKIRIKLADGKTRAIQFIATTTYRSAGGRPISAQEFMCRLFGDLTPIAENSMNQTAGCSPLALCRLCKSI